jgi:hypothetical protein
MRNGLKLFEQFDRIVLEARVGTKRRKDFIKNYAVATTDSCREHKALITRFTGWQGGLDTKIYFDASKKVLESLSKLGIKVLKEEKHRMYYASQYDTEKPYPYSISDNSFFWWLVSYGYRLGENTAISFSQYLLQKCLEKMKYTPLFDILNKESENPIFEARLLAS